jgi:hypothetical protein
MSATASFRRFRSLNCPLLEPLSRRCNRRMNHAIHMAAGTGVAAGTATAAFA